MAWQSATWGLGPAESRVFATTKRYNMEDAWKFIISPNRRDLLYADMHARRSSGTAFAWHFTPQKPIPQHDF